MMLWPRSLLWRTFLLLALLVVTATAGWFLIFRIYETEPRARAIAQNVVSIVNLTRAALITASPENRRALLLDLAQSEGIQIYPVEAAERLFPASDSELVRRVIATVREQLGEGTRFASQRERLRGFWVSFSIDGDEYWVRIAPERIERRIALQWLGWGLAAMLLSLLAAYFIVSHVDRPLKALARAAADIGRGKRPHPVPETGPDELQTLSRAFNQMSGDLARLDADRALILAGVSHDLRTPLARLRLGIEMSGADESTTQGMNADIEEMDRIVSQFLDFARAESGEVPAHASIGALAQEVVEHYRKLGYAIETDIRQTGARPVRVMAMHRALSNLVDNALRYAGSEVKVLARNHAGAAILEVLDRGPGIPREEADRLKQPFTRLDAARSGRGGSGLGLAIVERIVQAHDGRLELLPREGGGLAARITLPA